MKKVSGELYDGIFITILRSWDVLAGAVVVMVLYHRIIVGPLEKRIIYLEEESQEILDEVYALSQR